MNTTNKTLKDYCNNIPDELDDPGQVIYDLKELIFRLPKEDEIEELRSWKASAIKVMPDMQAIGKALRIGLGQSVHDKILPGIGRIKTLLKKQVTGGCNCEGCQQLWEQYEKENNL